MTELKVKCQCCGHFQRVNDIEALKKQIRADAIKEFINAYYEYCESQYGILADDEMADMSMVKEKLIKEQK